MIALVAAAASPARAAPSVSDEARAILDELLRVDTSHGNESLALKPIGERLRKAGIPFEINESSPGRGNLVARIKGSGTRRPLLLLAHIDVVPVEGQPWKTPPFVPTEAQGSSMRAVWPTTSRWPPGSWPSRSTWRARARRSSAT